MVLKIIREIFHVKKDYHPVINNKKSYKNVGFQFLRLALRFPLKQVMLLYY